MIESLPEHLLERTRIHNGKTVDDNAGSQRLVLDWMRTAVRSEENTALDVVRWLADHQDIPLLIYHAISEHYEYASDRHHMFMLQGARDVQRQVKQLGLDYAFHLATGEDREPHLDSLANMARVVVTEDHFQMAAGGVGQSEDENWGQTGDKLGMQPPAGSGTSSHHDALGTGQHKKSPANAELLY